MEFQLTAEQRAIKNRIEDLAEEEFAPRAFTYEEGEIPWENMRRLGEEGLIGLNIPEQYGGGGYSEFETILAIDTLGRYCPVTANVLHVTSMVGPRLIAELGDERVKEKFLPPVMDGEAIMGIAISEPEAGSAANEMTTTAKIEDDEVVLHGEKVWVGYSHHPESIGMALLARFPEHDGEIGSVVVEPDAAGVEVNPKYTNMRGEYQSQILLDDCRVPRENLIHHGEQSFVEHLKALNIERLGNATSGLQMAQYAFDRAVEFANEREQFGQKIGGFQGIQWMIAEMATKLEAARLLIYRAAANAKDQSPSRIETSMAKWYANEIAEEVASTAMQIHGARGYMQDNPVEWLYRAVRGQKFGSGTVEIHKNNVGEQILDQGPDAI